MKYFEKGQVYNYDDIENILDNAFNYVIKDINKEQSKMDDEIQKMVFELHTIMILSLYKTALLNGVGKDNE